MFEGARLKVKRANKHILDFDRQMASFCSTDFYVFGIDRNGDSDDNILQLKMTQDIPSEIPLTLGDAIHNLRSALDMAYVELIKLAGKNPTKWTTFRVFDDRDKLISTLHNGILKGEDAIISMLADSIRAYKGGNDLLEALDALDQIDKHVMITPVISTVQLNHVDFDVTFGNRPPNIFRGASLIVGQRGILNAVGVPTGGVINIHSNGKPAFNVLFGDGTSLKFNSILPAFSNLTQTVNKIIISFETFIRIRIASNQ